jgi:hypothetical protein
MSRKIEVNVFQSYVRTLEFNLTSKQNIVLERDIKNGEVDPDNGEDLLSYLRHNLGVEAEIIESCGCGETVQKVILEPLYDEREVFDADWI